MSRWKAAFIHLLISLAIVGSVAAYIVSFWYPPALMHMAKADKLLLLVAAVDLTIGPLLTLIVFKVGKPTLRMDLTVIAVLQAGFLAFGLYAAFVSRPVFLVASPQIFDLMYANDLDPEMVSKASKPEFRNLGVTKPVLAGAVVPTEPQGRAELMRMVAGGKGDLAYMPQFYVDYQQVAPQLLHFAKPLKHDGNVTAEDAALLQEGAKGYGRNPEELVFVPLRSSRGFAVMLLDGKTGAVVGPVNVDP